MLSHREPDSWPSEDGTVGTSVTMRDRGLQGLLGPVGPGEIGPLFALSMYVCLMH